MKIDTIKKLNTNKILQKNHNNRISVNVDSTDCGFPIKFVYIDL